MNNKLTMKLNGNLLSPGSIGLNSNNELIVVGIDPSGKFDLLTVECVIDYGCNKLLFVTNMGDLVVEFTEDDYFTWRRVVNAEFSVKSLYVRGY
jgi:hypothetical protein